jgi:hypothetical protein
MVGSRSEQAECISRRAKWSTYGDPVAKFTARRKFLQTGNYAMAEKLTIPLIYLADCPNGSDERSGSFQNNVSGAGKRETKVRNDRRRQKCLRKEVATNTNVNPYYIASLEWMGY